MPEVRLIDANALKSVICRKCANGEIIDDECDGESCSMLREIENAPTIEAEPVRHGRWMTNPDNGERYCNQCGWVASWANERYCSYCGAKMDGGAENDQI